MSELNLPKRFKGFALPVVTTDGNTVIKTALLSDIIQALSDERTQNDLKTSRILELETDLLESRAEIERLNKNCPLSNMPHGHYVYCRTCEKDIPVLGLKEGD